MKKVNEGYCAELLLAEDRCLLKLYKPGWTQGDVCQEYKNTQAAHALGIPSPQVYGTVEQGNRFGFLMEQVEGETMLRHIQKKPFRALSYARRMARLHFQMHRITGAQMPSQKQIYARRIAQTRLDDRSKDALLSELEARSKTEKTCICHGDYHPMNILFRQDGPVVIDWAFASVGDPLADVAGTYMITRLLSAASAAQTAWERCLYDWFTPLFAWQYLWEYRRLSGCSRKEILDWIPIRAATYLDLGLPEQANEQLRKMAARIG